MKNIVSSLILIFSICTCAQGQTVSMTSTTDFSKVPQNAYVKDFDGKLNPFIGTWRWTDGNAEFIVQFVKKEMYNGFVGKPAPYKIDTILGGYKYTFNGMVLVNTLNFTTTADINNPSTFQNYATILTGIAPPFIELSMNFDDRGTGNKSGKGRFKLIDPLTLANGQFTAATAHWKIYLKNNTPVGSSPFTFPDDLIMTKMP